MVGPLKISRAFRGKAVGERRSESSTRRRGPWKASPLQFHWVFIYKLCFYLRKLIMEHSSTLHKRWAWGVYQVPGNHKKRISPRVGAEKGQRTWCLPAGKKFKKSEEPWKINFKPSWSPGLCFEFPLLVMSVDIYLAFRGTLCSEHLRVITGFHTSVHTEWQMRG